jgi:hypothetical protein
MHPTIKWGGVAFAVAFVGAQAARPARTNPHADPSASLLRHAPPAVSSILQRSCRDCHSNDTTWPWYSNVSPFSWMLATHVQDGRANFNYSQWSTYSVDDQDQLLGAMCSLVRRGRMPLKSYLLIHHDAGLTPAEVATLCTWSDRMRDTLE